MLGNRRLISDRMGEFYDLLEPWTDENFWDFTQVTNQPGDIYVFGRQHLLDNLNQLREMAESDK